MFTYFLYSVLIGSFLTMIYCGFQAIMCIVRLKRYEKELQAVQKELLKELE